MRWEELLGGWNSSNTIRVKGLCILGILTFFVLFLALSSVAEAMNITAWSSSGGNPTHKDNPQDLIYKVQLGDTITFTATSNQSCDWVWEVYFGARVIANFTENNTKTSSFTWQVPNENSTWSIEAACMNISAVGLSERAIISWTITTANLTEVNEGGDIQSAIDSLPVEGGIVELKEGIWNITAPIRIRNDSITLVGQGMDKTIINQVTSQTDAIDIGKFDDPIARNEWLYQNNIKREKLLNWFRDHPEEITQNVQIKEMTVNVKDASGDWDQFASIAGVEVINVFISEIKGTANPQTEPSYDDSVGIFLGHSIDITVKDCILYGYGYTARPFMSSHRVNFLYNRLSQTKSWNSLEFNGVRPLRADWKIEDGWTDGDDDPEHPGSEVRGNKVYNGGKCLYIYSSWGVTVTENSIENTQGNFEGIRINNCGDKIVVSKNFVSGCSAAGLGINTYTYMHCKAEVFNNIFSKSKYYSSGRLAGHGITITSSQEGQNTVYIYSNTIVDNEGDGIYNPEGWPVTIKNNIIVNNKGAGIRNGTNISHNDVWNNTGGNYVDCNPGDNDISIDPLFADPDNEDFHLKSQYGRWDPDQKQWVKDNITSPCIDAGDPADDYSNEPDYPNGKINLGAYGNTREASFGGPLSTGTLKGKVTDKDTGLPIEGAVINADSHSATTNSSGDYIMSLPVGNYTVTASKEGYQENTTTAEILENQTTILNFTLTKLNVTVTAPANKWTSFRMHPSYNLTFEQISANLTNHQALSYYNKSIGLWQSYWVGYDFNKNVVVSERESLFAYFSADTNLSCSVPSPKAKPLKAEKTVSLYLRGFGDKKIEEIKTALVADGCSVVQVCGWDKVNQVWNCTDDFVVHPSEGFIVQTSNDCVWREIV